MQKWQRNNKEIPVHLWNWHDASTKCFNYQVSSISPAGISTYLCLFLSPFPSQLSIFCFLSHTPISFLFTVRISPFSRTHFPLFLCISPPLSVLSLSLSKLPVCLSFFILAPPIFSFLLPVSLYLSISLVSIPPFIIAVCHYVLFFTSLWASAFQSFLSGMQNAHWLVGITWYG